MNQVKRLDLRCSELCLLHDYGWLQARISRLVSRTGDGPLYLLLALALLGQGQQQGQPPWWQTQARAGRWSRRGALPGWRPGCWRAPSDAGPDR